jgi:hypothetical protein
MCIFILVYVVVGTLMCTFILVYVVKSFIIKVVLYLKGT